MSAHAPASALPHAHTRRLRVACARRGGPAFSWAHDWQGFPHARALRLEPLPLQVMVAFNSVLQIILYAPLSIFYLQVRAAQCLATAACLFCQGEQILNAPPPPTPPPAVHQVLSGGTAVTVGFWPVAKSVLLFLGVPLVAGVLLRVALIFTAGRRWFEGAARAAAVCVCASALRVCSPVLCSACVHLAPYT